ncbi:maleylpyruvate isomerase N-terminal domain-containing protein [Motilibacter rhizosphaerae]|uniref:maleylpyruvate isomerase N-terminal domain-containing protein n=1 Tax=Motilibacter rhizosphaerae TaxID=598652 RepID=UPI0013EEB115|nr:maleylpyruvate isomerase N-terminal domain-containing protein [Motilibacter rhizosphaerae]
MDAQPTTVEIDLEPATRALAGLVRDVPDEQLEATTPCVGIQVAALVAHLEDFATAFAAAAGKRPTGSGTPLEQLTLADGWRDRVPERLSALADA